MAQREHRQIGFGAAQSQKPPYRERHHEIGGIGEEVLIGVEVLKAVATTPDASPTPVLIEAKEP